MVLHVSKMLLDVVTRGCKISCGCNVGYTQVEKLLDNNENIYLYGQFEQETVPRVWI